MVPVNHPVLLRVIQASVIAANHAGNIIRNVLRKGDLAIVEKRHNDPQTEADRLSQHAIVFYLSKNFPKCEIKAEEVVDSTSIRLPEPMGLKASEPIKFTCPKHFQDIAEKDICIWVDPLDGTAELVRGSLDCATVLIGLSVDGVAIAGVIHQPFYKLGSSGRTIWGLVDYGTHGIKALSPPGDRRIITTSRLHASKSVQDAVDIIAADEVLYTGGCGNKVLMVIEGQAHAYVFASGGLKKWDTCAPEAVLHSLGGCLTDVHGKQITYHSRESATVPEGVLATYKDHSYYLNKISTVRGQG